MSDKYRRFEGKEDPEVQQEVEQTHAMALDRLRATEDFVLISFDKKEKLWKTCAAIGKFQDMETIQGLFNCLHKLHDALSETQMSIINRAIMEHNAEDWNSMDEEERETLAVMLALILGPDAAERIVHDLESISENRIIPEDEEE